MESVKRIPNSLIFLISLSSALYKALIAKRHFSDVHSRKSDNDGGKGAKWRTDPSNHIYMYTIWNCYEGNSCHQLMLHNNGRGAKECNKSTPATFQTALPQKYILKEKRESEC
ncbi:hypothetical protein WUBG_04883 [Wuchereria bancrofti]|uniref:Uncharacterized protein n=1 Tax=Wuchereria bancrofti TaxID=6293 RepID=J9ENX5_WUCBA|nr:hypothetical protein WUBG_04883 [Wuchereria bancrofti]